MCADYDVIMARLDELEAAADDTATTMAGDLAELEDRVERLERQLWPRARRRPRRREVADAS